MTRWLVTAALAIAVSAPSAAFAACSINNAQTLDFGAYDVFESAARTSVGSISVSCPSMQPSDTFTVSLSRGSSGTYGARTMQLGAHALSYNIYLDAQNTVVFGDGSAGSQEYGPYGPSALVLDAVTIPIYGAIPARQNVPAGVYVDTIVMTVTF
jgi:spore coat protein U-like protein